MAKNVVVQVVDDIDGDEAAETISFADEDLGNSSDPLTEIPQLSAEVVCC